MHEHFRAMNVVKVEHVLFQDLQVEFSVYLFVFGEKERASLPFSPQKHPQTITDCGCLTIEMVYRGSKQFDDLGCHTVVDRPHLKDLEIALIGKLHFPTLFSGPM